MVNFKCYTGEQELELFRKQGVGNLQRGCYVGKDAEKDPMYIEEDLMGGEQISITFATWTGNSSKNCSK